MTAVGCLGKMIGEETRDKQGTCSHRILEATVKILDSIMSEMGNQCRSMSTGAITSDVCFRKDHFGSCVEKRL